MFKPDLAQTLPADGLTALRLKHVAADVSLEARARGDVRLLAAGPRDNPPLMPTPTRDGETIVTRTFAGETILDPPDHITLQPGPAVSAGAAAPPSIPVPLRTTGTMEISGLAL